MAEIEVSFEQFFDSLAALALEQAPFEGAAIAFVDPSSKLSGGLGAAGIFDGSKVRDRLRPFDDKPVQKALAVATEELAGCQPGKPVVTSQLGTTVKLLSGEGFQINNVPALMQQGVIRTDDLYVEGHHVTDLLAIPLRRTERPWGELIGLLVFNNAIDYELFEQWRSSRARLTSLCVLVASISACVTQYATNPKTLLDAIELMPHSLTDPVTVNGSNQQMRDSLSEILSKTSLYSILMAALSAALAVVGGAALSALLSHCALFGLSQRWLLVGSVAGIGFSVEMLMGLVWLSQLAKTLVKGVDEGGE